MGKFIQELGQQLMGGFAGNILGMGMGAINDSRQYNQQKKLQALQIQGAKHLTEFQMRKQLEMWENTSYPAQMEMMKKAGINPALMYGMGGGGGQSTGAGVTTPTGATTTQGGGGELMGMQLMGAQKDLIQAQTEKTKAETAKTSGVDTQEAISRIGEIAARTENLGVQKELMEIETSIKQIQEHITGATQNAAIATVMYEMREQLARTEQLETEKKITQDTSKEVTATIKAQMITAYLTNEIMRLQKENISADTKLKLQSVVTNKAQMAKWASEIQTDWHRLNQDERKTKVAEIFGENAQTWGPLNSVIGAIDKIVGFGNKK